jgi:4-hydroxymandelate oxidase
MLSYREIYDKGMDRIRQINAEHLLDLGAETRSQNRLNREFMDSLTFEMRFMGSDFASTRTTIFGREVPYPIQCAAMCRGRLLDRASQFWEAPYLEEFAYAVAEAGSWFWAGAVDIPQLQRLINTGVPVVRIVKPRANEGWDESSNIIHELKEAEDRGCIAVGMDIDVFFGEKTGDEPAFRYSLGPQSMEQMHRYVEATSLPFIAKGVLSVSDALKCKEVGAQGIVVSHHGGEAIDYAVPILRILPRIRAAVPDMTIFVDTGFQRGTDILKALALGADGVCVLTILMIAYIGHGRQGVANMLQVLADELMRNMSVCGCKTIDDITSDIIWFPYPDYRRGEMGRAE